MALPRTGLRGVEKRAENRACTNNMAESESTAVVKENDLLSATIKQNNSINTITSGSILNLTVLKHY